MQIIRAWRTSYKEQCCLQSLANMEMIVFLRWKSYHRLCFASAAEIIKHCSVKSLDKLPNF